MMNIWLMVKYAKPWTRRALSNGKKKSTQKTIPKTNEELSCNSAGPVRQVAAWLMSQPVPFSTLT